LLDGACGEPDAGPTRTSGSGGRHEETGREQSRNRASCRPHHDVAVVDEGGKVVARARIGNDAVGFARLLTLLAEAGDTPEKPIPVAIETDRGLLVAALRATDRPIYAINPLAASRYRSRRQVSGAKSDAMDAVMLADILRTDATAHRPMPADSELAQAIRVLARAQQDAVWSR
jgi:hypothetical protein